MGSIGSSLTTTKLVYDINTDNIDLYSSDTRKADMRKALETVQDALDTLMKDAWMDKDTEHLYETLADYFPRSMEGDDAEKIIYVSDDYITTVDVRLHDDYNGKITATLESHSYSTNEFSDEELEYMGIERRY